MGESTVLQDVGAQGGKSLKQELFWEQYLDHGCIDDNMGLELGLGSDLGPIKVQNEIHWFLQRLMLEYKTGIRISV